MLWSYFTFVASGRGMYGETMVTISFSVLAGIMLTYRFSLYQFWFHTFFLLLFLLLFFLLQFVHCFACGYWLFPIYKLKKDFLSLSFWKLSVFYSPYIWQKLPGSILSASSVLLIYIVGISWICLSDSTGHTKIIHLIYKGFPVQRYGQV